MNPVRQRGLTIPELMIALTLGLLVLLLTAALLVSANAFYVSLADSASVDDGGRYALETITRAVRQAAFVNWDLDEVGVGSDPAAPARISGLDDRALVRESDGISDPRLNSVNGSDVLAVRFVGAGAGPDGDGSMINCAGFSINALDDGWSIFYVARNADGVAELRCKYRGSANWGADAIVSGVDTFQVLYGLDTDAPLDGLANQYVSATVLDSLDNSLMLDGANPAERERDRNRKTHWKRITSIKVSLLLHGAKRSRTDREPALYDLFGSAHGERFGAVDRGTRVREEQLPDELRARERKLFSSTILLRNPSM
jgi:type IV pilus assembly protein PilW